MALDPSRTLRELKELYELTSDDFGVQRLAWTKEWDRSREWLAGKVQGGAIELDTDPTGNQWFTLRGSSSEKTVVLGGHLDSTPGGGWLNGSLNLLAGAEVLRRLAAEGEPACTVQLVNWADSEGARFGHSLLSSSMLMGTAREPDEIGRLTDREGTVLSDAVGEFGVDPHAASRLGKRQLQEVGAYLELSLDPTGELEAQGAPLGVVLGTYGVERCKITWNGMAAHTGARKLEQHVDEVLKQVGDGALYTLGSLDHDLDPEDKPFEKELQILDQRHSNPEKLERMLELALDASDEYGLEDDLEVTWERIWRTDPAVFNEELVELADAAVRELGNEPHRMTSTKPLDASTFAQAGIPATALFVQGPDGPMPKELDDALRERLELSIQALDRLTSKTIDWLAR